MKRMRQFCQPRFIDNLSSTADCCHRNEFGILDIPREPCLLLCPHINLLTLTFADEAFAPSALTSPEQLFDLRILPGKHQMELPLKEKMKNVPLFRATENTAYSNLARQSSCRQHSPSTLDQSGECYRHRASNRSIHLSTRKQRSSR